MQYIIIGNFANHSIATLQYLIEEEIKDIHFIYVETGWAAASWQKRVAEGSAYAKKHGVQIHHLSSPASFEQMVLDRKQFPSTKFQWCAGFLKGLPITTHLDEMDPFCEATIVSGKRRLDSRRYQNLPEFKEDDDYFNGRTLWHPLYKCSNETFQALIKRSGFDSLPYSGEECSPCIHLCQKQLASLKPHSIKRLATLEKKINSTMYEHPIQYYISAHPKNESSIGLKQFDLGCGSPWCCGE